MSVAASFDERACILGEGPLWHPERRQLFWFDIVGHKLLSRTTDGPVEWQFDRYVSAAGWVDAETLLIATQTDLIRFDLTTGQAVSLVPLEADNPVTRSNDGRADPQGGFWIGTMGINCEAGAGALYRYYKGELRQLRDGVSIPNATCFAPDGKTAYFADTAAHVIWRYALDSEGWPTREGEIFLDHRETGINPDGAVVDAQGRLWCAEWGGSRVACYSADAELLSTVPLAASQPTCPAFGGDDLSTLFVTSASENLPQGQEAQAGHTFAITGLAQGQREHQVIL